MLDSVFAAKTGRTKMEEEPVMSLPEVNDGKDEEQPVKDEASKTTAEEPAKEKRERMKPRREERKAKDEEQETKGEEEKKDDEFDLSDITHTPKELSREEIIAAAEAAAYDS
jgi:ribonuclease-3